VPEPHPNLPRRRFIQGAVLLPMAGLTLAACGSDGDTSESGADTTDGTGSETGDATTSSTAAAATGTWASGGTDLITVGYPATSIFESSEACELPLTEATTEGPCYFSSDTGEDISQGKTGLPMQLCLQLVDTDCQPLADHVIEAWHCDTRGIYSGDTSASDDATSFAGDFCTAGDAEAEASTYFRGQLTTDAEGRVNFKTCFPGWYSGRTIHIHFAVSDGEGTTRLISQFCFDDTLAEEICTGHDLYTDRGAQDTPLSGGTDTVFPASDYEQFLLTTDQNTDGSLLGYSRIQIDPTVTATSSDPGVDTGPGQPDS
jgi:protocatechuate 3,4-dioxygenase beta subunit